MPALGKIALGMLIVFVDLRINSFDLVPDVVGWVVVLVGLNEVVSRSRWFLLAGAGAALGLVLAVADLATTGTPGIFSTAATIALVFGICTALHEVVRDDGVRSASDWIRWLTLGVGVLWGAFEVSGAGFSEEMLLLATIPLVVTLGCLIAFVILCWRVRERPELCA